MSQSQGSPSRYNEIAVPALGSHPTDGKLWQALVNLGPSVLIYTLSFMTLGIAANTVPRIRAQ